MSIQECVLIDLPQISDERGHLSFVENNRHIPFEIRRIYYLYGIPQGKQRGAHAHRDLQQLIIPIAGQFDVSLNDGATKKTVTLKNPHEGLYISNMIWRELENLSHDAVCLVLASELYSEADYVRNYEDFLKMVRGH
jgi:dTDP-4-dehydrorhamnose 3,5-epimerase-like enzyme